MFDFDCDIIVNFYQNTSIPYGDRSPKTKLKYVDSVLNGLEIIENQEADSSWYLFCCHPCDKAAKKIYENKLEKAGVNTDNDVHADRSMAKHNNTERTETLQNPTIKSTASATTSRNDDVHLTDGIRHSALTVDSAIDDENPQHRSLQTVASITAFETNNSMEQHQIEEDNTEEIEDNDKEDGK